MSDKPENNTPTVQQFCDMMLERLKPLHENGNPFTPTDKSDDDRVAILITRDEWLMIVGGLRWCEIHGTQPTTPTPTGALP